MLSQNVIKKCQSEARTRVLSPSLSRPMERASDLIWLPVQTLYRLQKKQRHPVCKAPKKHRMGKHSLDDFDKCVIKLTVADMYGIGKIFPTLEKIRTELKETVNFTCSRSKLQRVMKDMGFQWKRCEPNRKILMERTGIVFWRVNFLQKSKET